MNTNVLTPGTGLVAVAQLRDKTRTQDQGVMLMMQELLTGRTRLV